MGVVEGLTTYVGRLCFNDLLSGKQCRVSAEEWFLVSIHIHTWGQ